MGHKKPNGASCWQLKTDLEVGLRSECVRKPQPCMSKFGGFPSPGDLDSVQRFAHTLIAPFWDKSVCRY